MYNILNCRPTDPPAIKSQTFSRVIRRCFTKFLLTRAFKKRKTDLTSRVALNVCVSTRRAGTRENVEISLTKAIYRYTLYSSAGENQDIKERCLSRKIYILITQTAKAFSFPRRFFLKARLILIALNWSRSVDRANRPAQRVATSR